MFDKELLSAIGKEICQMRLNRRRTTAGLAGKLGISEAGMLAVMEGRKLPTEAQLETLFALLNPDHDTVVRIRALFTEAMRKCSNAGPWSPAELKKLRLKRGLSLPLLANRTGISTGRLRHLESDDPLVRFSPDEEVSLGKVLLPRSSELFVAAEEGNGKNTIPLKFFIPLMMLEDLRKYSPDTGLKKLSETVECRDLIWDLGRKGRRFAIAADAGELQLSLPGSVVLAVGEPRRGMIAEYTLCKDENDRFFLQKYCDGAMVTVPWTSPDAVTGRIVWSLPVIDIVMKPLEKFEGEIE